MRFVPQTSANHCRRRCRYSLFISPFCFRAATNGGPYTSQWSSRMGNRAEAETAMLSTGDIGGPVRSYRSATRPPNSPKDAWTDSCWTGLVRSGCQGHVMEQLRVFNIFQRIAIPFCTGGCSDADTRSFVAQRRMAPAGMEFILFFLAYRTAIFTI